MISQLNDPFNSSVATDPWSMAAVDVPSIHQAVFDSCLATLSQVRQLPDMPTRSILIYGSAGSGKTHLLGRLRKAGGGVSAETIGNFLLRSADDKSRDDLSACPTLFDDRPSATQSGRHFVS